MKWKKLAKIFDPADFDLPCSCVEFAQAPQALVFEDFVRFYFATRARDPRHGKYLSHIAFVDMKKRSWEAIRVSTRPVISLGKLGCFDEHGIFPMNVMRHGGRIYAYTCGWSRRVSVSVETSIGLAFSDDDGLTFAKTGDGPVLAPSLNEPFLVGDPCVKVYGGEFHMWYIFGTAWKRYADGDPPERIYKIGHARSPDGISWARRDGRQIIADRLNAEENQALPSVIESGGRYHMFFCYRQASDFRKNRERSYRIGYAHSDDLAFWTRNDDEVGIDVTAGGWDSDMLCYPHVFACDGEIYLVYNGNEFGRRGFGIAVLE